DSYGSLREPGICVKIDHNTAALWYRRAAEQGLPLAQYNLGVAFFFHGMGVAQSYEEAARWCRLAASQGVFEALHSLGVCRANGRGVPQTSMRRCATTSAPLRKGGQAPSVARIEHLTAYKCSSTSRRAPNPLAALKAPAAGRGARRGMLPRGASPRVSQEHLSVSHLQVVTASVPTAGRRAVRLRRSRGGGGPFLRRALQRPVLLGVVMVVLCIGTIKQAESAYNYSATITRARRRHTEDPKDTAKSHCNAHVN
ncbi:hypothetical protein M885DRAFT_607147, partial [Pelagophyceae sp. CCMP2097]